MDQPRDQKQQLHFTFLEGLRGLCALYVVIHHAWMDSWGVFTGGPRPSGIVGLSVGWLEYGHAAVTIFIAISGFCLMLPVLQNGGHLKSWSGFLQRRAVRILPPYYAALLIGLASAYLVDWPVNVGGVLTHVFLVHNWTQHIFELNGPLWSIAVECQIYLAFPLLVWMARKWSMPAVLCLTAIAGFGLYALYGHYGGYERDAHYVFIFALGMAAATWRNSWGQKKWLAPLTALSGLTAAFAYFQWSIFKHIALIDFITGIFAVGILIIGSSRPQHLITRVLSYKPLTAIGAFSYSIYLIHQPLQVLLRHYFLPELGLGTFIAEVAFVPFLLAIAYAFFHLIEQPFVRKPKKSVRTVDLLSSNPVSA